MPSYSFTVNGRSVTVDAPADLPTLWALRDKLGVTGPKYGCGIDVCKACTSHLDGEAFNPCVTPVSEVEGREVTTIEGLADGDELHPMQEAFWNKHGLQCGYCTPGMIMAATDLLKRNPNPSEKEVRHGLEGNLCRCTGYHNIVKAVMSAAGKEVAA
jgi:isoquinoline 1-oxidoreductase subunit alpha